MSHPIVLNLGVGRSGTTFIYNVMCARYAGLAHVRHEDITTRRARIRPYFRCYDEARIDAALRERWISEWIASVRELAESRPVIITGSTTAHLAPVLLRLFGERLRVFHVHRHPLNVVGAFYVGQWTVDWTSNEGWMDDMTGRFLTPFDEWTRYRQVAERWPSMGPFARMAYGWMERTAAGLEFAQRYPGVPHRLLSSSRDVFESENYLEAIAGLAGLPVIGGSAVTKPEKNSSWQRSVEERPLGEDWRQIEQLPELVELAESLGHSCAPEELERLARRYQLPPGWGSRFRHATRYWQARRRAAGVLRSLSLLPDSRPAGSGVDPRSTKAALAETSRYWSSKLRRRGEEDEGA